MHIINTQFREAVYFESNLIHLQQYFARYQKDISLFGITFVLLVLYPRQVNQRDLDGYNYAVFSEG